MAHLYVCSLEAMPDHVADLRPRYVVSLLQPSFQPPTPAGVTAADHHRAVLDDISSAEDGRILPEGSHMRALLDFFGSADPDESILIHCWAGISRSPAAALIALALESPGHEREAARSLRAAAPHAMPNYRLLALADEALGRGNALREAAREMGPPQMAVSAPHLVTLPRRLG
ncbi:MAG: protein tyrosine phosphatase [Myxococcota bacterium]|nr:protein tyrosine phosphatase [Myxococcota bacterium]